MSPWQNTSGTPSPYNDPKRRKENRTAHNIFTHPTGRWLNLQSRCWVSPFGAWHGVFEKRKSGILYTLERSLGFMAGNANKFDWNLDGKRYQDVLFVVFSVTYIHEWISQQIGAIGRRRYGRENAESYCCFHMEKKHLYIYKNYIYLSLFWHNQVLGLTKQRASLSFMY